VDVGVPQPAQECACARLHLHRVVEIEQVILVEAGDVLGGTAGEELADIGIAPALIETCTADIG
jgi:hypothetical protein